MPVYYPYFFSNKNIPTDSVNFPLVQNTSVESATACVCVGFADETGALQYIGQDYLDKNDLHFANVLNEATEFLDDRDDVEWENIVYNWEGEDISILRKKGDFLTASEILNPVMLKELQEFFQCNLMAVAIPNQTTIYVAESPSALASLVHREYNDAENHDDIAVSNMIYLSHNGEVIASAEVDASEYEITETKSESKDHSKGAKKNAAKRKKKKFTLDKSRLK